MHFGVLLVYLLLQPSGTKNYILIRTAMTWTSAQAYCRQHYHDLAMIENSAENQAVTDLLPSTTTSVWIGLYRTPWRWSDGNPSTYKKWLSGQPSHPGSENCVTQHSEYDLEKHLGLGLSLRWDFPPTKVEGMEATSDNDVCTAPRKAE
uniref:C-type lectin domain-containing protein n=1 Tax=Neogobius melanostomus TaxID=47308 RepID=A0A8C6UND1_9GOBI